MAGGASVEYSRQRLSKSIGKLTCLRPRMTSQPTDDRLLQATYYKETAAAYDTMHNAEVGEHALALKYVLSLCRQFEFHSILDVGCGTGVAVRGMLEAGLQAKGVEPVNALIEVGLQRTPLLRDHLSQGSAEKLPFADKQFDVLTEFAVLHHVKDPKLAVVEMTRVAKHAIFLSDENRFGRGSLAWRLIKLLWWKIGFFSTGFWLMTKGKGYNYTEGDGVSYSYSVFDSYPQLAAWADVVYYIPLKKPTGPAWAHPLLSTSHVLLCAIKHPDAAAP